MKFHAFRFSWLWDDEATVLFGFAAGRVEYDPEARWLYSFRLFLGICRVELNWTTGSVLNEH